MPTPERTPLLAHPLDAPSVFTPDDLMRAVQVERRLVATSVPPLCVLDFDGDLADGLVRAGAASPSASWACFHSQMLVLSLHGIQCGIVPRTIGGPYAVLVAEQLHAAGAALIVGITSAGRVSPTIPLPSIVVVDEAIRDEGTSLHYLPESMAVTGPTPRFADLLALELRGQVPVRRGLVWTTDAPYRETEAQLHTWAASGVLAVEMQAAGLFAFATARRAQVGMVALVSNGVGHTGQPFDTGGHAHRLSVLGAVARAATAFRRLG